MAFKKHASQRKHKARGYDLKDTILIVVLSVREFQTGSFFSLECIIIVFYREDCTIPLESGKQIEVIPVWKWAFE